jgi:Site-specific DNA methylase
MEVSGSLKNVDLKCCDFENSIREAREGDFVYLDPPYQPISETSSFTSYSSGGFGEKEQRRLAKIFRDASSSGVFLMISNSDSPLIRELYSDFKISNILAARNINSNGKGRGKINEVLITNY